MGSVIGAFRCHPWHSRPVSQEVAARWILCGEIFFDGNQYGEAAQC
jgi:hypothetical protein